MKSYADIHCIPVPFLDRPYCAAWCAWCGFLPANLPCSRAPASLAAAPDMFCLFDTLYKWIELAG